jgi:hypothetical protein
MLCQPFKICDLGCVAVLGHTTCLQTSLDGPCMGPEDYNTTICNELTYLQYVMNEGTNIMIWQQALHL